MRLGKYRFLRTFLFFFNISFEVVDGSRSEAQWCSFLDCQLLHHIKSKPKFPYWWRQLVRYWFVFLLCWCCFVASTPLYPFGGEFASLIMKFGSAVRSLAAPRLPLVLSSQICRLWHGLMLFWCLCVRGVLSVEYLEFILVLHLFCCVCIFFGFYDLYDVYWCLHYCFSLISIYIVLVCLCLVCIEWWYGCCYFIFILFLYTHVCGFLEVG